MAKLSLSPQQDFQSILQNAVDAHVVAGFKAFQGISRDAAQSGQTLAIQLAARKLRSTFQKYISGLQFNQPDDDGDLILNVTLDKDASYLETGYGRFDMKPGILRNAKHISAKGDKYQPVPFGHQGTDIPAELNRTVQIRQPMQTTRGNMLADLAQLRGAFAIPDVTTLPSGKAATGKVWSIRKSTVGPQWHLYDRLSKTASDSKTLLDIHPNLSGVTKIQYKRGGQTRAAYMTWRTATENTAKGANKFVHPGFSGVKILEEVEKHIIDEINRKIAEIFQP